MVTPQQKQWSRVFSMRNIREFVKTKDKLGVNSFENIAVEKTPKWQQSVSLSPVQNKTRPRLLSRYSENRPSRIDLTPGPGDVHYKRINDLCLETRKSVQVMIKRFRLRRNSLRNACKNCEDAVNFALEQNKNHGLSKEMEKMKQSRQKRRNKIL